MGISTPAVTIPTYARPQGGYASYTAPTAPSNLTALVSGTTIDLSWVSNSTNETGFTVEQASSAGGPFSSIATKNAGTTVHSITGAAPGTYYFRVRADRNVVYSGYAVSTAAIVAASSAPSYTPLKLASFEGGTLNAAAVGSTAFASVQNRTTFSNAVAGPFAGSRVARMGFDAAGTKYFGGDIWNGSQTIVDGTSLWVRVYEYYESGFDFGYLFAADGSGIEGRDGWGYTKWLRMWFADGADNCYQNSEFGKCAGMTAEGGGYSGSQNLFFDPAAVPALPTAQWICREYQIFHHATAGQGFIRYWQNGTYVGQVNGKTKPPGTAQLTRILTGDYWNGCAKKAQYLYQDEIVITAQTPDAVDAGGRPFIGTTRKVADFA